MDVNLTIVTIPEFLTSGSRDVAFVSPVANKSVLRATRAFRSDHTGVLLKWDGPDGKPGGVFVPWANIAGVFTPGLL